MNGTRVRVRRDRPTALAVAIALAVTMLAVYVLTLDAALPDAVEYVSAAPRVTREISLQALEGWCVSLGAWPTADQARVEAAGYAASGAAGRAWKADGQWHVLGAMADSEKRADRMVRKLRDGHGIDAEVLCLTADAVRLRVTAPEAQIDLIARAAESLKSQSDELADMADRLDRGEMSPDAARTLCALSATEAGAMAQRLDLYTSASDDALCAALTGALAHLSGALGEISQSGQPAIALSGMLRMAGIDSFLSLRDIQQSAGR